MRAFYVIDNGFHIEDNRYIGTGTSFRDPLRVKLARAVNDQFPFLQVIRFPVDFRCHAPPVNVSEFKIGMCLASELVAGVADGVIISKYFADSDAGENSFK